MKKKDLVESISKQCDISKTTASDAIDIIFQSITDADAIDIIFQSITDAKQSTMMKKSISKDSALST